MRERVPDARSRSCFAGAADAESQSAAKLPAQPPSPSLPPSPRLLGRRGREEGAAAGARRLPARGRGRRGAGPRSPRAVPSAVPAEVPAPRAWAPSTKDCPSASGRQPHDEQRGAEAETWAPGPPRPSAISSCPPRAGHPSLVGRRPSLPTIRSGVRRPSQSKSRHRVKHTEGFMYQGDSMPDASMRDVPRVG